jgi:L-rhamnose mutarotase
MYSQTEQSYLSDIVNSDIYYRTKHGETPEEMNKRIRNSISVKFNKILLKEEHKELFNVWEKEVSTLPAISTREQLYGVAPEECLHIIGL